jgi:hypothetical protein
MSPSELMRLLGWKRTDRETCFAHELMEVLDRIVFLALKGLERVLGELPIVPTCQCLKQGALDFTAETHERASRE